MFKQFAHVRLTSFLAFMVLILTCLLCVSVAQADQTPYLGSPIALPGTVQAEYYDYGGEGVAFHDTTVTHYGTGFRVDEAVDVKAADGGYSVGWISTGEWLEYTVTVDTGTYNLSVRAGTPNSGCQVAFALDGVTVDTVAVTNTGAYSTYATSTVTGVSVSGGNKVLRLSLTGGMDINWVQFVQTHYVLTVNSGSGDGLYAEDAQVNIAADAAPAGYVFDVWTGDTAYVADVNDPTTTVTMPTQAVSVTATYEAAQQPYSGSPIALPGTVQAEYYDYGGEGLAFHDTTTTHYGTGFRENEAVDVKAADGGYSVGWTATGEWLEYAVTLDTGTYDLSVRAGTSNSGCQVAFALDGQTIGTVNVTNTGAYSTYAVSTTTGVSVTGGTKILRLTLTGSMDVNWIEFEEGETNTAPTANAGSDQYLDLPNEEVYLLGSATDDGLPGTGLTYAWTKVSGPGTVSFSDSDALKTAATITTAGTYVLRLTVSDGSLQDTDDLTVKVSDCGNLILPVVYTDLPKPTADTSAYTSIYTIDLQTFGIYNDGTHATETSAGINDALQYAKTICANYIIFPAGTYLISETDPVVFDHQDTIVDLNGATLQSNTNALAEFCTAKVVDGASNFRLTNGTIRGDKDTHTGGTGEWGHCLLLESGSNLEIDHLTLTNAWGDGLVTESNMASAQRYYYVSMTTNLEQGAFTSQGVKTASAEKTRTINPYDVSVCGGQFEFGYTWGYQGFPYVLDRPYQVYFYQSDMTFIEKADCIQYKKHAIPANAKYMHMEFNQASVTGGTNCGSISNFRPPTDVHVHDVTIIQNRRNGLSVCGGQKMIIENSEFIENGGTAPNFGIDYEDGWELQQDIVLRNNYFEDNVDGDLVVCAGSELVFEGNAFEVGPYVWERTHNYTFRGNQNLSGLTTYKTKTGAASVHDNYYENMNAGPITIYVGTGLPVVKLTDEVFHNCGTRNSYILRGEQLNTTKLTMEYNTFEDCTIEVSDAESRANTFIDCTITDSKWNSHHAQTYTNCVIDGLYTISHQTTYSIEFYDCDLTDVRVEVKNYTGQTDMDVIFDDCDIEMNIDSLVTVKTDRLSLLQITYCNIDNNTVEPVVDNWLQGDPADTVVIENNTYE